MSGTPEFMVAPFQAAGAFWMPKLKMEKKNAGGDMEKETDVVIVGTGAAGLFCALQLPTRKTAIPFWHRAGSVSCVPKTTMKAILRTP